MHESKMIAQLIVNSKMSASEKIPESWKRSSQCMEPLHEDARQGYISEKFPSTRMNGA